VAGAVKAVPLGYQDVTVTNSGVSIPVSVWYPVEEEDSKASGMAAKYPHKISVGKIATLLTRGKLNVPSFIGPSTTLSGTSPLVPGAAPPAEKGSLPGIIFAHGYLGSRYDMMHICEELASMGFVVAAPEMPESLSASYEPNERVQRSGIVDETIGMMQRNFAVGDNLGIFGHSAGGGTSTNVARPFKLGRCAIAGFRGYGGDDPLLVVASVGDGIIPLDGIKSALPPGCRSYVGGEGEAKEASLAGEYGPGKSVAVLFDKPLGQEPLAPSHISFLNEQSNDAMVQFLSSLIPVARFLEVPLLDFDKYADARDSKATAQVMTPLVAGFFQKNLGRSQK